MVRVIHFLFVCGVCILVAQLTDFISQHLIQLAKLFPKKLFIVCGLLVECVYVYGQISSY